MRKLILIIGLLFLAVGVLWVGQGLGYINWPANSFMISQVNWAYYGAGMAAIGLIMMWFSRR